MRLGIVSCNKCRTLTPSEQPLLGFLNAEGHAAEPLVWNDAAVDWKSYDGLLVRSIWDYHLYPKEYFQWLQRLEDLQVRTWNPIPVLRWNAHKFYLRDLEEKGIAVAPTLFLRQGDDSVSEKIKSRGWSDIVVKPAVSASGYWTHVFQIASPEAKNYLKDALTHGDFLVQPLLRGIAESGEVSLIFLGNRFSHAVLKKPKQGDFRVQSEYGGQSIPFTPDASIVRSAEEILRITGMPILYARVDGLVDSDRFILMELELIEPDLFLEMRPGADRAFAQEFLRSIPSDKPSTGSA